VLLGVSKVLTGTCGGDGPRHEKGRRHHKFCMGEGGCEVGVKIL